MVSGDVPTLDGCTIESTTDFTLPNCRMMYSYWVERCDLTPDIGPQHTNFELTDIIDCAPFVVYKDVIDGGKEFRNRYWGTEISKIFSQESTGKSLGDYYDGGYLEQVLAASNFIISKIHAVKIAGKPKFVSEDNFTKFEACYVPLFDETGAASRLAAAFDIVR